MLCLNSIINHLKTIMLTIQKRVSKSKRTKRVIDNAITRLSNNPKFINECFPVYFSFYINGSF
jgi:hypothetical protein